MAGKGGAAGGTPAMNMRLACLELATRFSQGSANRAVDVAAAFEAYVREGLSPARNQGHDQGTNDDDGHDTD